MESKLKPPRVGTLLRASVFAGIGLFAIKQPFNVMETLARYPRGTPPGWFWPAVWGSMVLVVALCGTLAWRVAREAFPPRGTLVFPVIPEPRLTIIDVCTAPFAALFLLVLGLLPNMFVLPVNGFGVREMDVLQLLIIVPMGALLILWRPTFHVTKGEPLVRYPMGGWLPWKKVLPMAPKFEWRDFWTGKQPRRHVGWSLHANIGGRFEFELDFVDLNATRDVMNDVEAQWREVFGVMHVGTPEQQRAAVANDKPVKPWHILAAIFGLPGLALSLGAVNQKHYDNTSLGVTVLMVLGTGALALWFASRFVSTTVISVLAAVLAVAAIGGGLRGRQRAEAAASSNRIRSELSDVCKGKAAQHAAEPDAPEYHWAAEDSQRWTLLKGLDGSDQVAMPKKMMCLRYSTTVVESKTANVGGRTLQVDRTRNDVLVEVRDTATGALITSRSFTGDEPPPFPETVTEWRGFDGSAPALEELEQAFAAQ